MARPDSWFRMYNAVVDNPKVQGLSDKQFRAWVNLLCVASQNGGKLPSCEDIAFKLRITPAKAQTICGDLGERALFDHDEEGNLIPHDWNDLQFKSDTSTPRVKRFRDNKRNVSETENETHGETDHRRAEHSKEDSPKGPQGAGYSQEFLNFWVAYPNKTAKDAAWKAWKKRKDRPEIAKVLAALDRYVRTKPSDIPWKNPATWINGGCWNDEPVGSATVAQLGYEVENTLWRARLNGWTKLRFWNRDQWGPTPEEVGCKAPKGLLPMTPERILQAG